MDCIAELIEKDIKTQGEYFLADALQLMIDRGAKLVAKKVDVWEDCGKARDRTAHTTGICSNTAAHRKSPTENSVSGAPRIHRQDGRDQALGVCPYVSVARVCPSCARFFEDCIINENAHIEGCQPEPVLDWQGCATCEGMPKN